MTSGILCLPTPPPTPQSSYEPWLESRCLPPAKCSRPAAAAHATLIKQAIVSAKSSLPMVCRQNKNKDQFDFLLIVSFVLPLGDGQTFQPRVSRLSHVHIITYSKIAVP